MKLMSRCAALAVAIVFAVTAARHAGAQSTPPGPNLSGTWTLDTYLSDSPEQVATAVRIDLGLAPANRESFSTAGRGSGGGGFGRNGRGERGGQPREPQRAQLTEEEQARVDEVTTLVRYAPATVTISQTASSVTFTDARGGLRTYQTDGKREKQTFGSANVDAAARWEGPQLVIDIDLPKDRRMTTSWSVVPTTKQLLMRVTFTRGTLDVGPFPIKQVYNRSTGS